MLAPIELTDTPIATPAHHKPDKGGIAMPPSLYITTNQFSQRSLGTVVDVHVAGSVAHGHDHGPRAVGHAVPEPAPSGAVAPQPLSVATG